MADTFEHKLVHHPVERGFLHENLEEDKLSLMLNDYGRQGWELTSITPIFGGTGYLSSGKEYLIAYLVAFKRKLPDVPK